MKSSLMYQFELIQAIRNFFTSKGFCDVLTPPLVENPGMETHIHPFSVHRKHSGKDSGLYLHTSPEFAMKKLLADGLGNIFTIGYCFRDEPKSPIHRNQFIMLEWYRENARYESIMDDCEQLFQFAHAHLSSKCAPMRRNLNDIHFERATVAELFHDYTQLPILDYLGQDAELRRRIEMDFHDIPLPPQTLSWDDLFFLLFLNRIEPELVHRSHLLVYEYPAPLAALSTIKTSDPRVCERFEIYANGVELCNCFNELRDIGIQKKRFEEQRQEKQMLYGYTLPEPNVLYDALERGFPESAGIAMGVERFLASLIETENPFFT